MNSTLPSIIIDADFRIEYVGTPNHGAPRQSGIAHVRASGSCERSLQDAARANFRTHYGDARITGVHVTNRKVRQNPNLTSMQALFARVEVRAQAQS